MLGKIKGWEFKRALAADGSKSTLEKLTAEKRRLEARLLQIPKIIPQLEASLKRAANDIPWLRALKGLKKRRWEKEKGKSVEQAIYDYQKAVVAMKGQLASLTAEQKQIPTQLKGIEAQLNTLVEGESKGLEKGLDKEIAKEIGEIELLKEKERLAHERAIRETELDAEGKRLAAEDQKMAEEKAAQNQNKRLIGIGLALLIIVAGIIVYKRKMAKTAAL